MSGGRAEQKPLTAHKYSKGKTMYHFLILFMLMH
ncbi:hypothetical protein [Inovirus D_HF35_23]|nr:hypothetical protein [Inovirus D_HF35_23]